MRPTKDQIAALEHFADRERKCLEGSRPTLRRRFRDWKFAQHDSAVHALLHDGYIREVDKTTLGGHPTFELTHLGWAVAGDPPLHLCHPATAEAGQ